MSARRAVVIAGPTASGKSALGAQLARTLGGAVVNADALQLYRDLKILSARPEEGETDDPPHLLYGVLGAGERASAGWWARRAADVIKGLWAVGRTPVLVGGSGLYLRALITGLSPMPVVARAVSAAVQERFDAVGLGAFRDETARLDPDAVGAVEPADVHRLLRIRAVVEATGETITAWRARPPRPPLAFDRVDAFVLDVDRADLHRRCETRFDDMMAAGALEEVRSLRDLAPPPDAPVRKAVGVGPLIDHIEGRVALEEAVAIAKRDTRRYAKRQDTWFRGQTPDWTRVKGGETAIETVTADLRR